MYMPKIDYYKKKVAGCVLTFFLGITRTIAFFAKGAV